MCKWYSLILTKRSICCLQGSKILKYYPYLGPWFRPRLTRVKEDTGRSLFGKPVTQSTRQSRGSGRWLINETYFMICSERHIGFRPRLTRVKEDTGRSLFGKPVTQSTRQSRGSGGLLIKETYFMNCS